VSVLLIVKVLLVNLKKLAEKVKFNQK